MRKNAVTSTAEDYLKAVLKLEDMHEKASTSNVARRLAVADGTVTDMLRKLQSAGLLEYTPYHGATLTSRGRAIALKILRRHRLIELFLHRIMGYGWEQVHDEAERLEHAVSDLFVERIDVLMNYPSKDPHGEVIPDARGFRESEDYISLAEAEEGRFTIRKVINASPELLTYLNQKSLVPGQSFTVLEKAPFQGPLKLQIRGKTSPTYVGHEVANCIFVCRSTNGTRRPHGSKRTLLVLAGKKITSRKKGK
jgi:DtxR family Mn-dependent transcriptional regulator